MKVINATSKLTKAGFSVSEIYPSAFRATKENLRHVVEFHRNGGGENVTCIRVRCVADKDDVQTDYCAGVFVETITSAIAIAQN